MILSNNTHDFVANGNTTDLKKFTYKQFSNLLHKHEPDEIVNSFIAHCLNKKVIETFNPSYNVKFSTYIYKCYFNYVMAYYCSKSIFKRNKAEVTFTDLEGNSSESFDINNILKDELSEDIHLDYDRKKIYDYLCTHKRSTNGIRIDLPLHKLYLYIVNGYTDKAIAVKEGCTVSYVGCLKRKLEDKIRKFHSI